jgi:hypothetical protein
MTEKDSCPPEVLPGLINLWRAYQYAQDAAVDVWEFAVGIADLRDLGLTTSEIRWLVGTGHVEHALETSLYGDEYRSFRAPQGGLTFLDTCAFVLTDSGVSLAEKITSAPATSK